jgi:hypothetical protein
MSMQFGQRLFEAQAHTQSNLAIGIAPVLDKMPMEISRYDDPLLPYGKAVIRATEGLACAYVFHLGAYLAYGAAGAVALERSLAYVPEGVARILHGPFAGKGYVKAAFEDAFAAHAVTLTAVMDIAEMIPYIQDPSHGIFLEMRPRLTDDVARDLAQNYPGQVGVYRKLEGPYKLMDLLDESGLEVHWYWGDALFYAHDDGYAEAWAAAAAALRDKHIPQG